MLRHLLNSMTPFGETLCCDSSARHRRWVTSATAKQHQRKHSSTTVSRSRQMKLRASFREGYTDDVGDVVPQQRGECRLVNCE
jgi:hypothetical protein